MVAQTASRLTSRCRAGRVSPSLRYQDLDVDAGMCQYAAAGRVHYRLRRPYYTGQTELVLEPVDFLRKLAALVPPPRQNQVRFYGLLAPQRADTFDPPRRRATAAFATQHRPVTAPRPRLPGHTMNPA